MPILINEHNQIIIQGITGKEGTRAAGEMVNFAQTQLVAGIRPGKAGEHVHGIPVFNTIADAKAEFPDIDTSMIYVPAPHVLTAAREAISNGIQTLVIITEHVPVKDVSTIYQEAQKKGTMIIGPSSVGVISPGIAKLGCIGAVKKKVFTQGRVGIISKSGGLCAETALLLTRNGIGQSTVVGIGGDVLTGSSFYELVQMFEDDDQTDIIVIIGELGGVYEEQLVELRKSGRITKPLVAFIGGRFTEQLPGGIRFGHAGAFIHGDIGKPSEKMKLLQENGIRVAQYHDQLVDLVQDVIQLKQKNGLLIAGKPLHEVMQQSLPAAQFLLLTGREPSPKEERIFEKILISIIDHGPDTTSSATSRFIISGGNDLNVGVGGGILSIGDYHGGAIENAMTLFYELLRKNEFERREIVTNKINNKETIFGFGHKIYKEEDPRVAVLKEECQNLDYQCDYFTITDLIEQLFIDVKGKKIPLNIDGCIAALLCSMGVDSRLGKGIFIIGRTPGLVWQSYDELRSGNKVKRL